MFILFIVNPVAGKKMNTSKLTSDINDVMSDSEHRWEIVLTEGPGDAETLSRWYSEQHPEGIWIFAVGGDGTLNEVVNGAVGFPNTAIGCIPMGSGNDFIKLFEKGGERLRDLKSLINATPKEMDLIECNGRYSINICSVGLDARIGIGQATYKKLPFVTGKGAYIISLIVNVIRGISRGYEIEVDGAKMAGKYTLICVCNGRWYGGSFNPSPDAVPDDGLLDIVIVKGVSIFKVAGLVGKYAKGEGKNYPDLIHVCRGKELRVQCDQMSMVNLDGERLDADLLSISVSANRIRFLVPEGAEW